MLHHEIELGTLIFPRRHPLVLLECSNKVAQIIEPIPISDLRDRIIRSRQLITRLLDPLMVQIIHRRLMCHLREKSAEILRRHGYGRGKLLKSKGGGIVVFDKVKYLFQLQDTLVITPRSGNAFQVVMIAKNNTEKVVKTIH